MKRTTVFGHHVSFPLRLVSCDHGFLVIRYVWGLFDLSDSVFAVLRAAMTHATATQRYKAYLAHTSVLFPLCSGNCPSLIVTRLILQQQQRSFQHHGPGSRKWLPQVSKTSEYERAYTGQSPAHGVTLIPERLDAMVALHSTLTTWFDTVQSGSMLDCTTFPSPVHIGNHA